jgi:hypothetical protein
LAEAIGNFGNFFGPLFVGALCGALLRFTVILGRHQLLLTPPGMISLILLLLWVVSYEYVASTFIASALQSTIAILALTWLFRVLRPA